MTCLSKLFRYVLVALVLIVLGAAAPSESNAAKKKPTKSKVSTFVSSLDGTLKVNLISKTGTKTKRIKAGAVKEIVLARGTKLEFVAKPKAGFKAGIIVNGELVRFQKEKAKAIEAAKPKAKAKIAELKYKIPAILTQGLQVPYVEIRFAAKGSPFAKNAAISFSGLGASIKVTNQSSPTFSGQAKSDVGISSVSWKNNTTGASGVTTGTKDWSAAIPLAEGDNKILASLNAKDGSVFTNDTEVTYYPGIDFVSPLHVSEDILFVGAPVNVLFNIGLATPAGAAVSLLETDGAGVPLAGPGIVMSDNGVLPDEIDADGVFSVGQMIDTATQGFKYFRVKVEKPGQTYFSEKVTIWITTPFSDSQVKSAVDLANLVRDRFNQLIASGMSEAQALATILAEIKLLPIIGAAGGGDGAALWWITSDGILGGFHPTRTGQRAGGSRAQAGDVFAAMRSLGLDLSTTGSMAYYSKRDLEFVGGPGAMMALDADPNRVKTHKSLLLSPYIAHPNTNVPSFGNTDDFYGPWQILINQGSLCSQKATKSVVNNGAITVSLADFQGSSEYGFVHFSTHADNYYNGLLNLWKDEFGVNDFLKGYLSLVVVDSGVMLPTKTDGTFDTSGIEDDLKAKRVALWSDGTVGLLPGFFMHHLGGMPNSLVLLSACRSSYNSSMADAFLAHGAGAVIGFTDYVSSSYAQNTTNELYTRMIVDDKTIKEAFDSAVTKFGATDADKDPAALTLFGNNSLKRYGGSLVNAGFEDAQLSPWEKDGDGRLIGQLGGFTPVEGSYMGIVSTGLGFTTSSGTLTQTFCMPQNAQSLNFSWNYSSAEFLEYCNSRYQDYFNVQICEVDPQTEAELGCSVLLDRNVDSLCGQVFPVDFNTDRGGVYSTGWINASLPIGAALGGKSVKLKVAAGDVGDSIYDTAVLVDAFEIIAPTPAP